MIVLDSSALLAIALRDLDGPVFVDALLNAGVVRLSPINFTETGMVLWQRGYLSDVGHLKRLIARYDIEVCEDLPLGAGAFAGFLRYGKGIHPARLNLGDCFAYALAKQFDAPLLYKGDDFAKTDIRSALQPT